MVENVNRPSPLVSRIPPLRSPAPARKPEAAGRGTGTDDAFAGMLQAELARRAPGALQFSRHAQERLAAAGRTITPDQIAAVEAAVEKAAAKGARESLVLMPDLALVVNVRNRTVITAVDEARMREQVFTNIDSAVIVDGG